MGATRRAGRLERRLRRSPDCDDGDDLCRVRHFPRRLGGIAYVDRPVTVSCGGHIPSLQLSLRAVAAAGLEQALRCHHWLSRDAKREI
jgi:hypothetical protein